MISKSPTGYLRLKNVRDNLRCLPDLPETANPRYGMRVIKSHRRGQNRFSRWLKYA